MDPKYAIDDTSSILSPGLVVFRDLVEENVEEMIRVAGSPSRLRPHCKTHKMAEVTKLQLDRGITKHKAATFAEAEMLARAGAESVFLAYNLVGPNVHRAVAFKGNFPDVHFAVTADHPAPLERLASVMRAFGTRIEVLMDVDCGMHRTGIGLGEEAFELYARIDRLEGVVAAGLHVYDGQNHQDDLEERVAAVEAIWTEVSAFRDRLSGEGLPVPRVVVGGTPTFPAWARIDDPDLELSPGTCVLHDCGYGSHFKDQRFTPAALLLTRVISRPTPDTMTLDVGNKAVAADPPAGSRLQFPDLPDAEEIKHNEEHLVLRSDRANDYAPGDELLAIPRHVCPTSALHRNVWVVSNGKLVGTWDVTARDRKLSV